MTLSRATKSTRRRLAGAVALAFLVTGCATKDASVSPQRVNIDARPNGIAVRTEDGALFMTDDASNSVLLSTDGLHFTPYATVGTVAGQPNSLSELVFAGPNLLFVARFGFGSQGGVFEIAQRGPAVALSGLDPKRRRLGLTPVSPGKLLSTWFVKEDNQPLKGGVSLISYDARTHSATERDVLTGFGKPIGVAVFRDHIYITDQTNHCVVDADLNVVLDSQQPVTPNKVLAQVNSPDLLAVDHTGQLFTKCGQNSVCRIASDGDVTVIADDFSDARGVTIDDVRDRVYWIDRTQSAAQASAVRTLPLR
ncbi:conserved exported protein of unknown function [Pararobbsia alpina]|uniref:hypothetical protein n=1 Tax=Pararobbsia alpina TaxID=621374 RepID=UPI0039A74986